MVGADCTRGVRRQEALADGRGEQVRADDVAAAEQARLLAAGEITAPELIELYLERIARLDPLSVEIQAPLAIAARAKDLADAIVLARRTRRARA